MQSEATAGPGSPLAGFENYDAYYGRLGNRPPDWAQALLRPSKYACTKPWLPLDKRARILDFGCAWGNQLLALWCAGFENLEGVELVPEQGKVARDRACGRIPIHSMDGRAYLRNRSETYDLIVVNDVLEHIPVPEARPFVAQLFRALKPNGCLVLRTPNMSSLLAAHSRYLDATHRAGYTEAALVQLLDQAGFAGHRFVPDSLGWRLSAWRPWAPWRGVAWRGVANLMLHKAVYALRGQTPVPTRFGYNLEAYSYKPPVPRAPMPLLAGEESHGG
jgi:2-polyprenyl-3-methyl-5-hydroxy-6-metoxy-1,4-benzoquinol methylase